MAWYLISFTFLVNGEISYFQYSSPNERNIVFPLLVSQEARYLHRQLFFRPQVVHFKEHSFIYKDNSHKCTLVCTQSVCCFCHILTKIVLYWHVVIKSRNMKHHDNPFGPRRVVPRRQRKGQTHGYDEASIHYCFAKLTCSMFRALIICIFF